MRLFAKKQEPVQHETGYQDVVDYLRDIDQQGYAKILKVVSTYREADKKVKKILNIKDEPAEPSEDWTDLLIDDDADSTASKTQRETAQKATNVASKVKPKKIAVKQ